jgi:hypothetical protein
MEINMNKTEFDKALVVLPSDDPWVRALKVLFEEVNTNLSMSMIHGSRIEVRLNRHSLETGGLVEVRIQLWKYWIYVKVGDDHQRELSIPAEGQPLSQAILEKAISYAAQRAMMDVGL